MIHRKKGGVVAFLVAGAVVSGLAGCAVDQGANGQIQFKVDQAELFGTQVARFAVGTDEGTLRVSNGVYSIKLRDRLRVITLVNAVSARVVRVDAVADRTAVLVERAERGCGRKYQLFSIRGGEVLSWEFGDCVSEVQVAAQGADLTYDFARDRHLTRFTYRDMRLLRADAVIPPPAPPAPALIAGDRFVPGLPTAIEHASAAPARIAAAPASATSPAPAPAPAGRPTARTASAAPPAPAPQKALVFAPAAEQTPIRIVLDK